MNKKTTKKIVTQMKRLIEKNGTTTTLEMKEACIEKYPDWYWTQKRMSEMLDEVFQKELIDNLTRRTNGTFFEYTVKTVKPVSKFNRSDLIEVIAKSMDTVEVDFVKADGTYRHIVGKADSSQFLDNFGYINFYESNVGLKKVDARTVYRVETKSEIFELKS